MKAKTYLSILVLVIGLSILIYPVAATLYNNSVQAEVANTYSELYKKYLEENPAEVITDVDDARKYNAELARGPILDPWLARVSQDNEAYQHYLDQLDRFEIMARLTIPAIGVNMPIYHGTEPDALDRGVGHLYGSDLPVGGTTSHTVLTAHSGYPNLTLFDNLPKLNQNDVFYIDVMGEKLQYVVTDIRVVEPTDIDSLYQVEGKDLATLITCTPYGINSHRLLVTGERVPLDPEVAENIVVEPSVVQPWMWYTIIFTAVVLLSLPLLVLRKKRKEDAEPLPAP